MSVTNVMLVTSNRFCYNSRGVAGWRLCVKEGAPRRIGRGNLCPQQSLSAASGATRAKAASSTSSPATLASSPATRPATTPATRSSTSSASSPCTWCPPASSIRDKTCLIGNGVAIDPKVLLEEIDSLESRDVSTQRLFVSDRAHVVMPYHPMIDQLDEKLRGAAAIGTTGRGIGPCFTDKVARLGIRMGDLVDPQAFRDRLSFVLPYKNAVLTRLYDAEPLDARGGLQQLRRVRRRAWRPASATPRSSPASALDARRKHPARRRAGRPARPRRRHLRLRHVLRAVLDLGRRRDRHRHRPGRHHEGRRRLQGLHDARRQRPDADGAAGRDRQHPAHSGPAPRVRRHHGPPAPHRLVRRRRLALQRRAQQRDARSP